MTGQTGDDARPSGIREAAEPSDEPVQSAANGRCGRDWLGQPSITARQGSRFSKQVRDWAITAVPVGSARRTRRGRFRRTSAPRPYCAHTRRARLRVGHRHGLAARTTPPSPSDRGRGAEGEGVSLECLGRPARHPIAAESRDFITPLSPSDRGGGVGGEGVSLECLSRSSDDGTRGGACSRKPKASCPKRPSWSPAPVAPFQDPFIDLGVSQSFAMLECHPPQLAVPVFLFKAVQLGSQLEKLARAQTLRRLDDFCNR
jgi:hypothetical protein